MSLGLAKSTIKAYDSAWYFYSNFCASLLPLPFPVDISDFCCKEWLCFLSSLPCWNSSICAPHLTGLLPCSWSMAVIPWRDPGSPWSLPALRFASRSPFPSLPQDRRCNNSSPPCSILHTEIPGEMVILCLSTLRPAPQEGNLVSSESYELQPYLKILH